VAIKKKKKHEISDWGVVNGNNYPLEYLILNKLSSSCNGVNKMLDAYETDSEYVLVLEFKEDDYSLKDWLLHDGIQSEAFAKCFFKQLVEAVGECHREGVLHRDLKESNILVDKNKPEPKLIDFGISNFVENSPFSQCRGTFGYMAPEVFDESKVHDGLPAEVYSLGVILYDILTCSIGLEPPFEEEIDDDNECTNETGDDNNDMEVPDVSTECLQLIDTMLTTCPSDRPTISQILQHPWFKNEKTLKTLALVDLYLE